MKNKIKRKISANALLKYLGKEVGVVADEMIYHIDCETLHLNPGGFRAAGILIKDKQIICLGNKCNLPFILDLTGFNPKELCKTMIANVLGYPRMDNYTFRKLMQELCEPTPLCIEKF